VPNGSLPGSTALMQSIGTPVTTIPGDMAIS
jgi:hypothetical protein